MTVAAAVKRDLAELAKRDKTVAESGLAAAALALAEALDSHAPASSKSMCAKSLQDILAELRHLAPVKAESSPLDEIKARRDRKLRKTG